MKKPTKRKKCVYSISTSPEVRTKADELAKMLDRPRSKVYELAMNDYYDKMKTA